MNLPKIIHLIWFEEGNPNGVLAKNDWISQSLNYDVRLYTDDALILPEFRPIIDTHDWPEIKSDLLRWSLLLTVGGWYFDCDVRFKGGLLADVEAKYKLDDGSCFFTCFGGPGSLPASDVLACGPNWPLRETIKNRIAQYPLKSVSPMSFAIRMLTVMQNLYKDSFIIGGEECGVLGENSIFTRNNIAVRYGQEVKCINIKEAIPVEEIERRTGICKVCERYSEADGGCRIKIACGERTVYRPIEKLKSCPVKKWNSFNYPDLR